MTTLTFACRAVPEATRPPLDVTCLTLEGTLDGRPVKKCYWRFPEFGPLRIMPMQRLRQGVVLPLGAKRWRVQINSTYPDEGVPAAEQFSVQFTPTEEPETPYVGEKDLRRWWEEGELIDAGGRITLPVAPGGAILFGQPQFQGPPVFPVDEDGVSARALCSLYVGWGSRRRGNVNLLTSLDQYETPRVIWFEASP